MILLKKLACTILITLFSIALFGQKRAYHLPRGVNENQISTDYIIVRFKNNSPELRSRILSKGEEGNLEKAIPSSKSEKKKHPLSNIYKLKVDKGTDIIIKINELLQDDNVLYAEPYFNYRPLYIPNDPEANPTTGNQTYLSAIKAYDAWTIESGDSTITIGVLDSGIDFDHPDLATQIAYNIDDPINGIDDDNDGLVDNYYGWDIADGDNIPLSDFDPHGTQVSAMSSARVNNGIGMAGTGFKSKVLPIKIFTSSGNQFRYGYEAIALAADLGCKVINLSWGAEGAYSQFGQDVINYAVLENDAVIIAAAGNTNDDLDFYPASFDNVLSIAASDMSDNKTFFSTYSHNVDLVAPGIDIFTATNDGGYVSGLSGTSLSSPLVAGAAALVRARFPDLNALQIAERIRVSADDIYSVGSNGSYSGKLGKGRLNMLRALTDVSPSIRLDTIFYTNGEGSYAFREDTLSISIQLKNYLDEFNSGTVTISSESPYVTIINNTLSVESLGTLETTNNFNTPFQVKLSSDLQPNETISFRLDYNDGVYSDFEYFEIQSSPSYYNVASGNLIFTTTSDGDMGFDELDYENGVGVKFNGSMVSENIGPILSFSKDLVIDNAPNELVNGEKDSDFDVYENLKSYNINYVPVDVRSTFSNGDTIRIEQKSLANGIDNFIIQEYRIINLGNSDLSNFTLSIFSDWNLGNQNYNEAGWSGVDKLGYIHDGTTYVGIALLSNQDSVYSAINNKNFNGNTADIPTNITDSVKHSHSSNGIFKTQAGEINGGNDVSHLLGAHINNLAVKNSTKVAFAIVAGSSLAELVSLKEAAIALYSEEKNNPLIIDIAETCIGQPATINPESGDVYDFFEDVDLNNLLYSGNEFTTPTISLPTTYYVVNKDQSFDSDIYRVIAKPKLVNADFTTSSNPLLLDETGNTTVQFTDISVDGISWSWDFGNGYTSTVQNPIMNFSEIGTYTIQLEAISDIGCIESISHDLVVANRSNLPNISDQQVCKNEEVTLAATNATNLEFYSDVDLSNLIYSGTELSISFNRDTTIYVISTDSTYNSNVKAINFDIDNVSASFTHHPDTLDLSSKSLIQLLSTSTDQALDIWYINDQLASTSNSTIFDYAGLDYVEVKLIAESLSSCTDTLISTINFLQSPSPTQNSIESCHDGPVTINPGGDYLHFYSDASLNNLQAKGSSIRFDALQGDTTIYITNNSGYLESDPLEVFIDVQEFNSFFTVDPPILNLVDGSTVQLSDSSVDGDFWYWIIDNDTISTAMNPTITFSETGIYNINLSVYGGSECFTTITQLYEVVSITGINDQIFDEISIFPNPTNNSIFIKTQQNTSVSLLTFSGELIYQTNGKDIEINTTHLTSGIYIIALQTKDGLMHEKIIIQH